MGLENVSEGVVDWAQNQVRGSVQVQVRVSLKGGGSFIICEVESAGIVRHISPDEAIQIEDILRSG